MTVVRSFQEETWELIRAGFSGIYVETNEPSEALLDLSVLSADQNLRLLAWNLDSGLRSIGGSYASDDAADPIQALKSLDTLDGDRPEVLVLENFHRFLGSIEVVQALLTRLHAGKQVGWHIIILAPEVVLPAELDRQFVVISQPAPGVCELWEIAESLVEDPDLYPVSQRAQLQAASAGLTKLEAESAYSLSLVRHGRIIGDEIWSLKASWLAKSGFLELQRGGCDFDSVGGLGNLKRFCFRSLQEQEGTTKAKPKGVMLLGVPGTGKSAFAKALGAEVGRPVLTLDIGRLMGSLIGQTESNVRKALQTADAMSPCILFIDEVEKALAGVSSNSGGDSGVASRLFGTLLTWLNDRESDVYVVATCNDISRLPPEFSRAERFDAVLFLDLPTREEKDAIWHMYRSEYRLADSNQPADEDWTGAEIKACCRLASLLSLPLTEAAEFIVPVGVTAAESVDRLRRWASGRCVSASAPGIYRLEEAGKDGAKRRTLSLRPSDN